MFCGWAGLSLTLVFIEIALSLLFMTYLGRAFKLRPKLITLLAVGSSICGVSAIIATQGAIDADEEDSSYAIAAILTFTAQPLRVAESVQKMGLHYATITGVCRDDLPDEGAWLYAETIRKVKELNPGTGVEMLAPDFSSNTDYLDQLFSAGPAVFAHNVETVPRIFKRIRPGFRYDRSLGVLRYSRAAGMVTKSNLILGMGETREEVSEALRDLHEAGTEIITITQYLRPSPRHHPVDRWVKPEEFVELAAEAKEIGFAGVLSGPLVRSSYRAGRLYREALASRDDITPEEAAR